MKNNFRSVKSIIILSILVSSIFAVMIPTCSAGIFLNFQSDISVSWSGNETAEPAMPRGQPISVNIEVTYQVTRGALGRNILDIYSGKRAFVKLEIIDHPEWVTSTLAIDTLSFNIQEEPQTKTAIVTFQAQEDAPAYSQGYIKIRASVDDLAGGLILGYEQTFTLPFVPAYKPLIDKNLPEGKSIKINPMDTAEFPFEVENLGNAKTIVYLDVIDKPEGWNVVVTSQVVLAEEYGSTSTAYLTVKPERGFGYHFEQEDIRISLTPVRADNPTDEGKTVYETFLVESQGFSTYGGEIILIIGAIIAVIVALIVFFFKYRK